MRRRSASASAATTILAFSALAGASRAARLLGLDPLRFGDGRLGHGHVLGFQHRRLGHPLAGFADLEGLGLFHLQGGLGGGHFGLGHVFAVDGLGVGLGQADAHVALGGLHLRFALEGGRLFADLLLLVELGHADGLLALGLAGADLAELVGVGHLDVLLALGVGHA